MDIRFLTLTLFWSFSVGGLVYFLLVQMDSPKQISRLQLYNLLAFSCLISIAVGSVYGIFITPIIALAVYQTKNTARKRKREDIERELPHLIDFIGFNIEAGSSIYHSFVQAKKILDPERALIKEVENLEKKVELGLVGQADAIEEMSRNLPSRYLSNPLSAVARSLKNGTPLGATLKRQSEQLRFKMVMDGERRANVLAIKLLVPLVIFIFPASFLVILSPVIVLLWGGGWG